MGFRLVLVRFLVVPVGSTGGFRVLHTPFITRYGVEVSYFTIMPPAEHNFEHNTLASRMTPESTILFFSTIILFNQQTGKVNCKWFEPRSISSSYCVIVWVRVVLKRTVVGD